MIEGRGWKVKVCLHLAHLLNPVGSGICNPPVVDRQNSQRIKALTYSILEFNAFNARLEGQLALHLAEFFPVDSWTFFFLGFVAVKTFGKEPRNNDHNN